MSRKTALRHLGDALQGRLAADVDWMALIDLANRALVTPSVFQALQASGAIAGAPADAAAFLADVAARSEARNERLLRMTTEAVGALNEAGIEPVLLKGMALWASRPAGAPFSRIMSDVDLMVGPEEADRAIAILQDAGFPLLADYPEQSSHVAAELARPSDVGAIDLHRRPPGPPATARAFDAATAEAKRWGGRVRVPSPAQQIYLMCLHDQFHDGGYWRGGFDLRHLHDIAELTRPADGVDWAALDAMMPTRIVRNAIHAELVAAHEIAGADIPRPICRWQARAQFRRHLAQHEHPRWSIPLAGVGLLLEAPNIPEHRKVNRAGWRAFAGAAGASSDRRWGLRPSRIRGLMKMRGGKI